MPLTKRHLNLIRKLKVAFNKVKSRLNLSILHPTTIGFYAKAKLVNLLNHVFRIFYNSKKVQCNICGWEGNQFGILWSESYVRYNAKCPNCGSLERHRCLIKYILEEKLAKNGSNVLDIAPIKSFKAFFQGLGCKHISIDLASYLADIRMDITNLSFRDNIFDLVICYHVLEHVIDDIRALKEIYRVTKMGGGALIQIPINTKIGTTLEYGRADPLKTDHVREYGNDVEDRIRAVGFYVKKIQRDSSDLKYGIKPDCFFLCKR